MSKRKAKNGKTTMLTLKQAKASEGVIAKLDRRTHLYWNCAALRDRILADLGGNVSAVKGVLIERFVVQVALIEELELRTLETEDVMEREKNLGRLTQAWNSIQGLGAKLTAEPVISFDVNEYIESIRNREPIDDMKRIETTGVEK